MQAKPALMVMCLSSQIIFTVCYYNYKFFYIMLAICCVVSQNCYNKTIYIHLSETACVYKKTFKIGDNGSDHEMRQVHMAI